MNNAIKFNLPNHRHNLYIFKTVTSDSYIEEKTIYPQDRTHDTFSKMYPAVPDKAGQQTISAKSYFRVTAQELTNEP